jgi:hypothetical protein
LIVTIPATALLSGGVREELENEMQTFFFDRISHQFGAFSGLNHQDALQLFQTIFCGFEGRHQMLELVAFGFELLTYGRSDFFGRLSGLG